MQMSALFFLNFQIRTPYQKGQNWNFLVSWCILIKIRRCIQWSSITRRLGYRGQKYNFIKSVKSTFLLQPNNTVYGCGYVL